MALALRFEGYVRGGGVSDYAGVARLGHVSRARISQIMSLPHLAPDIQEALLFLPRVGSVRSSDEDINYNAVQGLDALTRFLRHAEALEAMPKPNGIADVAVGTLLWQLAGNPQAASDLAADQEQRTRAFLAEVEGFRSAAYKSEAVKMLLPDIAKKYTPKGGLTYDPDTIRVTLTFPERSASFAHEEVIRRM